MTANQDTAAPATAEPNGRHLRVRQDSSSSGPKNSTGYSLAAAPRPISTPATTGLRPCQATSASDESAAANRSQLVKAWTNTTGDRATMAASHGRRSESRTMLHTTTRAQQASSRAVASKYDWTALVPPVSTSQAADTFAATYMNPPVSTGYSTGWSRYGTAPSLRCSVKNSGTTSE